MLNTILFDLDGTLVPFLQDEFIHDYFKALTVRLTPMGYKGEQLLDALSDTGGQRRDYTMTELLTRFFTRQGEPREYLDWGFPQLNRHLFCGMGAYVLLAARPSVGKTALALQLGLHFAKLGKKVDFFSYETDEEKAADRIMSAQSLVSFAAINQGGIADEASMKNLISAKNG